MLMRRYRVLRRPGVDESGHLVLADAAGAGAERGVTVTRGSMQRPSVTLPRVLGGGGQLSQKQRGDGAGGVAASTPPRSSSALSSRSTRVP